VQASTVAGGQPGHRDAAAAVDQRLRQGLVEVQPQAEAQREKARRLRRQPLQREPEQRARVADIIGTVDEGGPLATELRSVRAQLSALWAHMHDVTAR